MNSIIFLSFLFSFICFNVCDKKIKQRTNSVDISLTEENRTQFIESPGFPFKPYPNDFHIQYNVNVNLSDTIQQSAARILVKFEYFSIGCQNDSLHIDLSEEDSRTFCGLKVGKTLISDSNSLKIRFSSNSFDEGRGYKIRLELIRSNCTFKYLNVSKGIIQTPNYPNNYNSDETCIWEITVPEGKFVKLDFKQSFDIPTSSSICGENYLSISKSGDFADDLHRFCGRKNPGVIVSFSNKMLIKFNSDSNIGKGFMAIFAEHDRPAAAPERLPMLTPVGCPCGKENINETRIVGGLEVKPPHRYPWMVAMVFDTNQLFCGGALINNLYVLTASHCAIGQNVSKIRVRIGQHSLNESTPMLEVSKMIMHKDYDSVSQYNDIALLKLKNPIQYTNNIQPICLPPSDLDDPDGLFAAGWGRLNQGGSLSNVMNQISLPQYSLASCKAKFGNLITDNHLCAGGVGGQDACQGDSGGPFMSRFDNRVNVVGVVSWGIGCAIEGNPGVYTKVSAYLEWIKNNTLDATYCLSPGGNPPNTDGPIQPNYKNCGIPNTGTTTRVVGGAETFPHEFPWTVVIAYNNQLLGSGSLIAANIVLTSALKLYPIGDTENLIVIVGAHDITRQESGKQVYKVTKIVFHPQFMGKVPLDYDYALIQLTATSQGFSNADRPICLPRTDTPLLADNQVVGAGWGRTSSYGAGSPVLRKVILQLISRQTCVNTYREALKDSFICTASDRGKDMCFGDGGAPLMKHSGGRMYLAGHMSWGSANDCANGKPSVFADIRYALPWITRVTGIQTA